MKNGLIYFGLCIKNTIEILFIYYINLIVLSAKLKNLIKLISHAYIVSDGLPLDTIK